MKIDFPEERNAFVFDHQHGRRDVTRKPAIRLIRRPLDFLEMFFSEKSKSVIFLEVFN